MNGRRVRPRLRGFVVLLSAVFALSGCGSRDLEDRLGDYRAAIDAEWTRSDEAQDRPRPILRLPDRAHRRRVVTDHRIGPFDFLGLIGCRLSEVVAERNGSLGRVLLPTRRLAYELDLIVALEACLPTLEGERAERLSAMHVAKQAELGSHLWNAVWLDEEFERYLSNAPAALIGGDHGADAGIQLQRVIEAVEAGDALGLERAFEQLRDDAPLGPLVDATHLSVIELGSVSARLSAHVGGGCGDRERRLIRRFREDYVPIQRALIALDQRARTELDALARLFRATAAIAPPPDAMRLYGDMIAGAAPGASGVVEDSLSQRLRAAFVAHAKAWQPIFEACGVEPGSLG